MGMLTETQLATLSMWGTTLGGVAQTVGAFGAARNASDAAKATAKLYQYAARDALMRGAREEQALRYKDAQTKGTAVARMAAGNLALDQGTPLDVLTGIDLMTETDAATIRTNAQRDAYAYRMQASQAQASAPNPWVAGAGALIEASGTVAQKWYTFGKSGVWDGGGGSIWGDAWRRFNAGTPPAVGTASSYLNTSRTGILGETGR